MFRVNTQRYVVVFFFDVFSMSLYAEALRELNFYESEFGARNKNEVYKNWSFRCTNLITF